MNTNLLKRALTLVIASLTVWTALAQENLGQLPLGYQQTWNARVMFNPEGGYGLENIKTWPVLYEAQEGDVYTVKLPTATPNWWNGQLQFKTAIQMQASHAYRLRVDLQANKASTVTIMLRANEDDSNEAFTRDVTLTEGVSQKMQTTNFKGKDIDNVKLAFHIMSQEDDLQLQISNVSLYDVTDRKELWIGTSYYNYCYYSAGQWNRRQRDMEIDGRVETQSWTTADFDDSAWDVIAMPVGNDGYMREVQTIWPGGDNTNYWIRRDFELTEVKRSTQYMLKVCHDDTYWIYVNGHLLDSDENWTNGKNPVSLEVPSNFLRVGRNVIAINQRQNFGGKFSDCGMTIRENYYESGDEDVDLANSLVASEVQVANIDQHLDRSFNYGGWVELYNRSKSRIGLTGLYISDDPANLTKFTLPNGFGVIGPNGYACIYFDHHPSDGGQYGPGAKYQVPFKLQADGGTLYLSEDGKTPFLTLDYPAAIARCSWARKGVESDEWGYNGTPTPAAANSSDFATERLPEPEVDIPSQTFDDMLRMEVTIPAGCTLRYTMDGSTPTLSNGYTEKKGIFAVMDTKAYRFRLYRDGYLPSAVVTRTFIKRDKDYYLPIISIVTAPDNLYGDSIGIYTEGVNGMDGRNHGKSNRNMDWQRPANIEYITADGQMVVNQEANICISGGWSRHFLPSSLKLKANKLFEGKNSFDYPFFVDKPYNKYKQLLVRNGGNDNDNEYRGRVRDAITQQALIGNGFYVDAQAYQPVHLFLNGKYIGQLNLREPNSRFNGTANYGYDDDAMDAFEYSNGYFQMAGTRDAFNEWVDLARRASDDNAYEQIRQRVDIDEVINFWAAVTYIGCTDCILNNNNVKGYRCLPDGKFHLTVMDQDWGWGYTDAVNAYNNSNGNELLSIYNGMRQNPQFRRQFVDSYCILNGSVFTPERCQTIADSIMAMVQPALTWEGRNANSSWNEQSRNMTSTEARNSRMNALRNAYGLGQGMNVKVSANVPQASLMLNGLPVPEAKLNGRVFAPVTFTASAPAGYAFKGWKSTTAHSLELFARDAEWRYFDRGRMTDNDWMSPNYDDSSWGNGPAPLGYFTGGTRDYKTNLDFGGDAAQKHITYYFRRKLTLEEAPQEGDFFTMNWTADDGFVVYVNGQEVQRYLMPEGEITYDTYATTYANDNPDNGAFRIPASAFQQGENVIAVEVHNNVPGSSDIYWAASLNFSSMAGGIVSHDNQLKLTEDADVELVAVFEALPEEERLADGGAPVRINEVSAGNDIYINEYGKRDDWVELYNTTDHDIDLAGMYLSDKTNNPQKYEIRAADGISTTIPAGGHLLVWASKRDAISQLHAPFKLDNADGCFVSLQAADGSWTDILRYNEHDAKETFGRYPDGSNDTYIMTQPTISRTNRLATYDFDLSDLDYDPIADKCTHTFDLAQGWNWFSHNMALGVPVDQMKDRTVALRSADAELSQDEEGKWQGALSTLRPTLGYKVQTTEAHTVELTDRPYDTSLPARVQKGWNWIGSPLANATTIEAALGNYQATDGDVIVGQDAIAFYADGQWTGTLTSLVPGQAYMLNAGLQQAFEWNALTHRARAKRHYEARRAPEAGAWTADPHAHPDVMPIVARLEQDGEPVQGSDYQVAAFVGDECRGVAKLEDGVLYLMVYGEAEEALTFRVLDGTGEEFHVTNELTFRPLDVKGTPSAPYILTLGLPTGVGDIALAARAISTQYYTLDGRRVSSPAQGIYLQRTIYDNGRIITRKLLRP